MKLRINLAVLLIIATTTCFAQPNSWAKWSWLMGEWKGEGSGQPGQGTGTFIFKNELDAKVLVRKSHSEYPASGNKPAITHDDVMIVYPDLSGNPAKAIYFDNERHVINYAITYSDKAITLLSDKIQNVPTFRLTYIMLDTNTVDTKFEMAQDGEKFMTYIEGKSTKVQ